MELIFDQDGDPRDGLDNIRAKNTWLRIYHMDKVDIKITMCYF